MFWGRSSSLVGYGIGIAEAVGSNPTRSTYHLPDYSPSDAARLGFLIPANSSS